MSTGTRNFTSIPRSYIYDLALNSIKDSFTREAFLRLKMMVDNCGRAPGDPSVIAGLLYPGNPPTRKKMTKVIKTWEESGLVMYFQGHGQWFIEVADNYETLRIAGNMKTESGFPEAPPKVVRRWERKFKQKHERKWKRVRNPNAVDTQSEHGTDQVRTQSEPGTQQVSLKRSEGKGEEKRSEGTGREGSLRETTDLSGADAPLSQEERLLTANLLSRITDKEFDIVLGLNGYKDRDAFFHQVLAVCRNRRLDTDKDRESAMKAVTNRCNDAGFKTPKGWMKVMYALRDNIRS